jgi:acyl carrier protein
MKPCNSQNVRQFILKQYEERIKSAGFSEESIGDSFDLLTEGIVDSLGILDLINAVEAEFNTVIDLEGLDAESLTILGPLCDYIGRTAKPKAPA